MNGKYGNRIDKYCYPLTLLRLRSRKFSCGVFCLFALMQLFACEYNYLHHIVIYLVNRRAYKIKHVACAYNHVPHKPEYLNKEYYQSHVP